jgi:photosystem II stability/assembly factor-like uncharacterized protein
MPRSKSPSAINDLFAYGRVVFAATDHGVSRSEDGGRTWRRVFRGPYMESVSHGPTGYVALGIQGGRNQPITAWSNGGIHWHAVRGRYRNREGSTYFGGEQAVLDGVYGIAVPDPAHGLPGSYRVVRTTDRGAHWVDLHGGPSPEGGLQMLPDGTIYITASPRASGCPSAVFRSVDLGLTWVELPGSCSHQPLAGVTFIDATHGFAVGGRSYKYGGGQVIETTSDRGASWTVTHQVGVRAFPKVRDGYGSVEAVSPAVAYVDQASCLGSTAQGPCGLNLYRTGDGGRHLTRLARPRGVRWIRMVVASDGALIAVGDGRYDVGVVATSRNSGRSWRLAVPPRRVSTAALARSGPTLLWHNTLGLFASADQGVSWVRRPLTQTVARRIGTLRHPLPIDRPDLPGGAKCTHASYRAEVWLVCHFPLRNQSTWILHSKDRGLTWVGHAMVGGPRRVVATGRNGAAYAAGGAIWRTTDGGAAWREAWPRLPSAAAR